MRFYHLPTFKNTTQGKWLLPEDFCAVAGVLLSGINMLTRGDVHGRRVLMPRFPECPGDMIRFDLLILFVTITIFRFFPSVFLRVLCG